MYAASVGHVDILLFLVEEGADMELKNEVSRSLSFQIKKAKTLRHLLHI